MEASFPQPRPVEAEGTQPAEKDGLFTEALAHAMAMIIRSRPDEVRDLAHDVREQRLSRDAVEFARRPATTSSMPAATATGPSSLGRNTAGPACAGRSPPAGASPVPSCTDTLCPQDATPSWATGHRY